MTSLYTPVILEHFRRPRNRRDLEAPDIVEESFNPLCGDRIRLQLRTEGEVITEAGFRGDACALCTASASLLTELIQGRSIEAALRLEMEDLVDLLQAEIPEARRRCVLLPLHALYTGLGRTVPHVE